MSNKECKECGNPFVEGSVGGLCPICMEAKLKKIRVKMSGEQSTDTGGRTPEEPKTVEKVIVDDVPPAQPVEPKVIEITPDGDVIEPPPTPIKKDKDGTVYKYSLAENRPVDFEHGFERKLLALSIRNLEFFSRNNSVMRFDYFVNQYCRDIYEQAEKYMNKYGHAISKEDLRNEIQKMFYERKRQDCTIDEYWEFIDDLFAMDLSGQQYTEDELLRFAQRQQMRKVLGDAIDRVTNWDDLTPILEDVGKALAVGSKVVEEGSGQNLCIEEFPKNAIQGFPKQFAELYSEIMESPYPFPPRPAPKRRTSRAAAVGCRARGTARRAPSGRR